MNTQVLLCDEHQHCGAASVQETYREKKHQSEEHLRAAVSQDAAEETTPAAITDLIRAFAAGLGSGAPRYVSVVDDPMGLFGWCSDGVLEKIKHQGGSVVYGWCIWEWPNVLLTAEFHAVWADPTEAPTTSLQSQTEKLEFSSSRTRPAHRTSILTSGLRTNGVEHMNHSIFQKMIAKRIEQMKPAQLAYEKARAAKVGETIEKWVMRKRPGDPLVKLIDDFLQACDDCDRLLDTVPGTGPVQPPPGFLRAYSKKVKLLGRIRQEK